MPTEECSVDYALVGGITLDLEEGEGRVVGRCVAEHLDERVAVGARVVGDELVDQRIGRSGHDTERLAGVTAPNVLGCDDAHVKSSPPVPDPASWSESPTGVEDDSDTPMSVLIIPLAGPLARRSCPRS